MNNVLFVRFLLKKDAILVEIIIFADENREVRLRLGIERALCTRFALTLLSK